MHKLVVLAVAGVIALSTAALGQQQGPPLTPVSGTVATVSDTEVDITQADGTTAKVMLGDKARFALVSPVALTDIKAGSFVGVCAMTQADGSNSAMQITVFPADFPGNKRSFHSGWNQGPNSTMTNGTVSEAQVTGASGQAITVTYDGGQQVINVPASATITTFAPADKTALVVGAHVSIRAFKADDGTLTAQFVSIGKDGFAPK